MSDSVQLFRLEEILDVIDLKKIISKQLEISAHEKILNYIELEKRRQTIGERGEQHVYDQEVSRLKNAGSKYADEVSREPARDPKNGYDIDSFTEAGERIYIEVKTTTGSVDEPFYMTANEREKAKQIKESGGVYQIHRVYNIETDDIKVAIYENFDNFEFEEILYRVAIK